MSITFIRTQIYLDYKSFSIYFKQESKQNIEAIFFAQNINFFAEIVFPLVKSCFPSREVNIMSVALSISLKKNWRREPSFPWWQD